MELLTIVLVGHTGVGKSASGNTILGRNAFKSRRSFRSVTTEVCRQLGRVGDQPVCVVDTPGISGAEDTIRSLCKELLRAASPVLFLLVLKIDRFTQEQQCALRATLDVLGEGGRSRTFLLFTGEDTLDNMTLEQFIHEDPNSPLPEQVQEFGDRYHVFNNTQGGQGQVLQLLSKYSEYNRGKAASPNANLLTSVEQLDEVVHIGEELSEVRMVLLGLPGAGKSSSGNTILGQDLFQTGCGFDPVSSETLAGAAQVGRRKVTVVDTPGITAQVLSPRKLFHEIMLSIHKAAPGPHAFLIVVRIGRLFDTDSKVFELLPKMFDQDAPRFSLVLFTHADGLGGRRIADLIQANSAIRLLVSTCGGRYCVFNNLQRDNRTQVHTLMDRVEELVEANGKCYSPAMFSSVHFLPLEISIRWHDLRDWFEKLLQWIDKMLASKTYKEGFKYTTI